MFVRNWRFDSFYLDHSQILHTCTWRFAWKTNYLGCCIRTLTVRTLQKNCYYFEISRDSKTFLHGSCSLDSFRQSLSRELKSGGKWVIEKPLLLLCGLEFWLSEEYKRWYLYWFISNFKLKCLSNNRDNIFLQGFNRKRYSARGTFASRKFFLSLCSEF